VEHLDDFSIVYKKKSYAQYLCFLQINRPRHRYYSVMRCVLPSSNLWYVSSHMTHFRWNGTALAMFTCIGLTAPSRERCSGCNTYMYTVYIPCSSANRSSRIAACECSCTRRYFCSFLYLLHRG